MKRGLAWAAITLAAAALNLATGIACSDCCVTGGHRPPPEHSPEVQHGRAEIVPSFSEDPLPMYLEIDCSKFQHPYFGTATASGGFDPNYNR